MKPDQLNSIDFYGTIVCLVQRQFFYFIQGCSKLAFIGNKGGGKLKKYFPNNYG
jgi:hypothetical protein